MTDEPEAATDDVVEVRLPAHSAYISLLRTVTAGLAARMDFTLDEIDDLRIAVDEACALLLPDALREDELQCRYRVLGNQLDITVSVPRRGTPTPSKSSFAWTVLTALAGDVSMQTEDHRLSIDLRKTRGAHR